MRMLDVLIQLQLLESYEASNHLQLHRTEEAISYHYIYSAFSRLYNREYNFFFLVIITNSWYLPLAFYLLRTNIPSHECI